MDGYRQEDADPLTTFDLRRFNAVRGQQAQLGREISRCLKELRLLRKDPLVDGTDEPEEAPRNEPDGAPTPANDDASAAGPRGDAGKRTRARPLGRAARGHS